MALNATELERLYVALGLDRTEYNEGLKDAEKDAKGFGSRVGKSFGAAGATLAAAGAGLAVGIGQAAFEVDQQIDDMVNNLETQLNISEGAAESLGQTVQNVYASNFGESLEEAGAAVAMVKQQFQDLDGGEIEAITEQTFAAADAFDKDFGEILDAQKVLIDEFGLTGQQAMDFIAGGFQRGLNRSDDFLDSVREYGNQFGSAGFDAEQFFSVLETGAEGGVLGTDKIADAYKEMFINLQDGSIKTQEAFNKITGYDYSEVAASITAGDEVWADYADSVIEGLNAIEDPIERQRLAVEIIGTMAEDLGAGFTEGLSDANVAMEDLAGSGDALNDQYDNLGARMEEATRRVTLALAPIGDMIGNTLSDLLERAGPIVEEFAGTLSETLGPAMMIINDAWTRMGEALGITNEEVTTMDVLMKALEGVLNAIVIGVQAVAVSMSLLADATEYLTERWAFMNDEFNKASENWNQAMTDIGESLPDWLTPGSPTPLEIGIKGIGQAIKDLPDMGGAIAGGAGQLAPAGSGIGGDTYINVAGVNATTTGDPGEAAIQSTVNLLREAIARKKASS